MHRAFRNVAIRYKARRQIAWAATVKAEIGAGIFSSPGSNPLERPLALARSELLPFGISPSRGEIIADIAPSKALILAMLHLRQPTFLAFTVQDDLPRLPNEAPSSKNPFASGSFFGVRR